MQKNILDTARQAGSFTTLVSAIEQAGLEPTLGAAGPYTVFAPADEAFEQLPDGTVDSLLSEPERLAQVLSYHVVPGRLNGTKVAGMHAARTLHGEELPVTYDGTVHVDGARVVAADIEASNGVIHVIDRVLLPASL